MLWTFTVGFFIFKKDVLIYRAEDMHSVDEVTHGERCTLALWFTLDSSHDEDAKILNCIKLSRMNSPLPSTDNYYPDIGAVWMPLPASNSMYIINFADENKQLESKRTEKLTFQHDLRVARSRALGFEFCITVDGSFVTLGEIGSMPYANFEVLLDALERPMKLKSDGLVVPYVFANSIHALQVLYFCKWKESEQQVAEMGGGIVEDNEVKRLANTQSSLFGGEVSTVNNDDPQAAGDAVKETITKDLWEKVLHSKDWEQYMVVYHNELQRCLPVWKHFKCISANVSQVHRASDD